MPESTKPAGVRASVTPIRNTPAAAKTPSSAMPSASSSISGSTSNDASAVQAMVKALRRCRAVRYADAPAPSSTSTHDSPGSVKVIVAPARTPTRAHADHDAQAGEAGPLGPEGPEERVHPGRRRRAASREADSQAGRSGGRRQPAAGSEQSWRPSRAARVGRSGPGAPVGAGHRAGPGAGSVKRRVPPWSCATQRATARPSPVPPPVASVPKRWKTRSRSCAATPGPRSATVSDQPVGVREAATRTGEPAGAWRAALSRTLTSSWRRRASSAWATRSSGMARSNSPVRPAAATSAMQSVTSTRTGHRGGLQPGHAGLEARQLQQVGRRAGGVVRPGRARRRGARHRPARPRPRGSPARRSWRRAACAARARRWRSGRVARRSTSARSPAIWLNTAASRPTSSVEVVWTRPE